MSKFFLTTESASQKIQFDDALEINRGGEGRIMAIKTIPNKVAKIYFDKNKVIEKAKFDKLSALSPSLFVKPEELLLDGNRNPVGFLMQYIPQDYAQINTIFSKNTCQQHHIDAKIKKKVIESLIGAVQSAHASDVVIGDLNPYNIMLKDNGDIKLIDTDSYQVPGYNHSGILLEDIRDYLYNGTVGKQSDYFALAVMVYNILTYTHPFKGVHSRYLKIKDRMQNKLPVFCGDPGIKIPKCHEPIADKKLQEQFKRIFIDGERFLIDLGGNQQGFVVLSPKTAAAVVSKIEKGNLIMRSIIIDSKITNVYFTGNHGIISTEDEFIYYSSKDKGYVVLKNKFDRSKWDDVYLGANNVVLQQANKLFVWDASKGAREIANFTIPDYLVKHQIGNILVFITEDKLMKVYLDENIGVNIKVENIMTYGRSYNKSNGLIHSAGGKQNIFYNSGSELNFVQSPLKINGIMQEDNIALMLYSTGNEIKAKYAKIKGMQINLSPVDADSYSKFAFRETKKGEGLIFEPADNKINVRTSEDFSVVSTIDCDLVSAESYLFNTPSGIITWDSNEVWLINTK